MTLYESKQWLIDIDTVFEVIPELDQMKGCSVLITGASGLVCSAVVDILFRYNDTHKVPIHIYAAGRNIENMRLRFGSMINRPDFTFVSYDSTLSNINLFFDTDFIIHGASNSSPDMISKEPVETMLSNILGVKTLLDFARKCSSSRLLYISSSEVYGKIESEELFKEPQYGYIDILNPRSSYSIGKSAAETLCISYTDEFKIESVIARPGHIYGPSARINDNHVSSVWAYRVAMGKDIEMKSDGSQKRSYCYCLDCASAVLKILLCGKTGQAYNISNPNSIIDIKTMGQIMAEVGNVKLIKSTPSINEKKSFNPMRSSALDSSKLQALGWRGKFDAITGINHTIQIVREVNN